jgi:hypothetical protein
VIAPGLAGPAKSCALVEEAAEHGEGGAPRTADQGRAAARLDGHENNPHLADAAVLDRVRPDLAPRVVGGDFVSKPVAAESVG